MSKYTLIKKTSRKPENDIYSFSANLFPYMTPNDTLHFLTICPSTVNYDILISFIT